MKIGENFGDCSYCICIFHISYFIFDLFQNGSFFKRYAFEDVHPIGDGTFSICMKCINTNTEKEYAVKIVRSNQNVDSEIEALNVCRDHPNIVSIVDVIKDDAFTYIITEWLAGKELFAYAQEQPLNEYEVRGIFNEIIRAITHMHKQNIAHRDLKLENIKFTSENTSKSNIKVLDFGFARKIRDNDHNGMEGACYTLDYAAPEILSHKKYTESCDLWSLGVILYALLCGELPFRRHGSHDSNVNSTERIMNRIKNGQINRQNDRWASLSDSAKDLIKRLLTVQPEKRITLQVISFSSSLSLSCVWQYLD